MDDKIDNVFISGLLQNMLDKKSNNREVVNVADLSKMLGNVTEKVALLKHHIDSGQATKASSKTVGNMDKYIDNYKNTYANGTITKDTTNPSLLKNVFHYEVKKTTTEATDYPDYLGTAQLEELLNDIKARAIEMVSENPTVADLITNTVTEATFEADPILNHVEISSPGYALSTFVFLNDVDNTSKRTAKDLGMMHISKRNDLRERHSRWSCKNNIAQSLEDTLQSKLKDAYNKVKTKVTKDYKKEMTEVKATLENEMNKVIEKVKKPKPCKPAEPKPSKPSKPCKPCKPCKPTKPTKPTKPCHKKLSDTKTSEKNSTKESNTKSMNKDKHEYNDYMPTQVINKIRNVRADNVEMKSKMKKSQKVKSTSPTSTLSMSTVDDFAMLTLYEQILSKTHESNLMSLMATNSHPTNEVTKLSKRNSETLSDLRLKKDVKRKYDDEDNMPDDDSIISNSVTTETHVEGTSLQALRDKIAFKDYVNGYKTYLDFQKKQGTSDRFSNLVKYQAHKHHKVEDIGKFILDKIPPVPAKNVSKRRKRNFLDFDFVKNEDLDVPNKNDSWFKQHFSIFERYPPSKFRTSETVKFKEATESMQMETSKGHAESAVHDSGTKQNWGMINGNEINLDELSKNLESRKHKPFLPSLRFFSSTRLPPTKKIFDNYGEFQYKMHTPPSNSHLFGIKRNTKLTETNQKIQNKSPKYSEGDNFLFETNRRRKRKIMKTTHKIIDDDEKPMKSKINRDGYVTLVTQPTAIINLMKTKVGDSKVKKLLKRLHLHRNKKKRTKIKKEKRYCTRVQRYNPIKKLKNMFSARKLNEPMAFNNNRVLDYDMITSQIDTFKSVVYDKIPSMEDLQKQVPNLSESYMNVTDNPGIAEATDHSVTFKLSKIKETRRNHEPKVLPTPKTFTVVLDPYPLHITKEQHKSQIITPETAKNMVEATTATKESSDVLEITSNDTPKSETEDLYSDYITPFYDLFDHDEKTEANNKIELLNNEKQSTVLHNSIVDKINQEYQTNGTKPYPYFYLRSEVPKTKPKLEYRQYNLVAEFIDEPAYETYSTTNDRHSPSGKRTPFFIFSNNNVTEQTKEQIKDHDNDRNKLLTERNQFAGAATRNFDSKKTRFEPLYTQPAVLSDTDYSTLVTTPSTLDFYDFLGNSSIDDEVVRGPETTITILKYTTQSLKDMEDELQEMGSRVKETGHRVKFINGLNEYAINKNMLNLRTDLSYKYSSDELEDLVRELNKIYLRRMQSNQIKDLYREAEPSTNNYARNFVKNRAAVKEPVHVHPIAKLIKQPQQMFNTPLPMKNGKFEKFLKENKIDVESVTSDMSYPSNASNESQPYPVVHKTKLQITREYNDTLIPENPIDTETDNNVDYLIGKSYVESRKDYLNDLERNLNNDYNEIMNERRKRMTSLDDTDIELIGRTQYNKAKHHLTKSKTGTRDATMKKQYEFKKLVEPKEDEQISVMNVDDNNEKKQCVTEPMHPEGIAQNFTNILLKALKTLESKTDNSNIDIKQDKLSNLNQNPTLVDPYADKIELLHDYRRVTKAERKATHAAAQHSGTNSNSDTITNSLNPSHVMPTTLMEKIHFLLTGTKVKNKRIFGLPFGNKGKAMKTMQTAKDTQTTQKMKIAGVMDNRVQPVQQKQTLREAKRILDKRLRPVASMYESSTAMPSFWSDQSKETTMNETITTDETLSDLMDYPTDEQKSTMFEQTQDTVGSSLEQLLKAYVNQSRPGDTTVRRLSSLLSSDDQTTDEDADIESDGTTDPTVDFRSTDSEENSSPGGTVKILKRDVDGELRTAKGVAALEIIVDLIRHNADEEITKPTDTKFESAGISESDEDIFTLRPPMNEPTDAPTNSIQVHIAIPYDNTLSRKRSAEPVVARKVFTARLATPVDLEYQIHYIDSIKPTEALTSSTTARAEIVSPGLYLLVDNFNNGNNSFALKPVKISSASYDTDIVEKKARNASTDNMQGLKLSKAFLRAVNKHLVDLYNNITESNSTEIATHVKREVVYPKNLKKVRGIFENDRGCDCKCKVNKPMCGVCAATDTVVKELSFEFDNLAKYINDHCTEIQTFFKVNPRGGKVLRDCVRRLDKSLEDYNKRNKGKCHGPNCKTFATYLQKRQNDRNSKTETSNLVSYVTLLNNNFNALSNLIPYVEKLKNNGDNLISSAKNCLVAKVKKRKCRDAVHKDDVYTFDNISVKFICSPESTSDANSMSPFDTAATDVMYMDYGFKKRSLKPNIINKLFSRKNKHKKLYATKKMYKKRQVDQVESPLIADAGGSFWRNYILRKTTSKPEIVISVVESNSVVNNSTTTKDQQKDSEISESVDSSNYDMGDLLNLIATDKTGDNESKGTPSTITSGFWMKKTKKTKPTKKFNKKTDKHHKKNKLKNYNNKKNSKQQTEAHTHIPKYNNPNASDSDITKGITSIITTTNNSKGTLATIPPTQSFGNTFLKKIKMASTNFLKKMQSTTEGYQLDLDDFMGHDEERDKRTEEKLTTEQTLPLISQQTVITGNGKPRFVVVTKPITVNVGKQSKINDYISMVLSMLNIEKKKQNEKEKKLVGDEVNNKDNIEEMVDLKHFESKFTSTGHTIGSWVQSDYSTKLRTVEQPKKKFEDEATYYDVFEELTSPPDTEKDSSTAPCDLQRPPYIMGKKKDGFLTKNLRLVLRPSKSALANVEGRSASTFKPVAEHDHTETMETDATLANVEEADPFKTRVAEVSSSAFVPDPCSNSRRHSDIDKRENPRQQDKNEISREKEKELDLKHKYDNIRIYRRTNLRNLNGVVGRHFGKPAVKIKDRPGFDSYADSRIERDRRKTSTSCHVYVVKKMQKRSSSKLNTDLSSLSGWVPRVSISRFLAAVLCFYLCCTALAAAVSRAFRM